MTIYSYFTLSELSALKVSALPVTTNTGLTDLEPGQTPDLRLETNEDCHGDICQTVSEA